jgi:HK97 family phage prohead protease
MQTGGAIGALELRAARDGSRRLSGRFPYNSRAVLSDGGKTGRPKKEAFASRAFAYRIEDPDEDIHLLIGHDYDRPLASRKAGTFLVSDAADAVSFQAIIAPELQQATYVKDFFAGFAAGLVLGISPGFRIPPERVVPKAEETTEENPAEGMALIRTILSALLYEFSMVTVPAYKETKVEERSGVILPEAAGLHRTLHRWRF